MTLFAKIRIILLSICLMSSAIMRAQYWATPTEYDYGPMAREITAGATSKYEQAEKIYRWICANIAYDVDYQFYSADETRENLKGVCHGYCELFYQLGNAVGLEVKIIPGFSKNLQNKIGNDRHSWIIAVTEKGDIMIDPTWGAGMVIDKVFYRSDSDMTWFDVNPYLMATSHMPFESKFYLTDTQISDDTFKRIPHIYPYLEKLGLDARSSFDKACKGELALPTIYGNLSENMGFIKVPLDKVLSYGSYYHVEYKENDLYDLIIRLDENEVPSHAWKIENGTISVDFMMTAMKEVRIVAMEKGKKDGNAAGGFGYEVSMPEIIPEEAIAAIEEYDPYLSPDLKNIKHLNINWYKQAGVDGRMVLDSVRVNGTTAVPEVFYDAKRIEIISIPMHSPLKVGQEYIFHFKAAPKEKWALIVNNIAYSKWEEKPRKEGEFIYKFTIPELGVLTLALHVGGTTYQHAMTWDVSAAEEEEK